MERTQNQKRSLGYALSILISYAAARGALFIVRSRNSCINDPIRSTSSSNAKWPVSRRSSSYTGNISLIEFSTLHRKGSIVFAPSDQHGGCCLRKYSCQWSITQLSGRTFDGSLTPCR